MFATDYDYAEYSRSRRNRLNDEINSVSALWGVSSNNAFNDDEEEEENFDEFWDDPDGYGALYA